MTIRDPHGAGCLSGGLDSMLAIRILQMQGIEVEASTFARHLRAVRIRRPRRPAS